MGESIIPSHCIAGIPSQLSNIKPNIMVGIPAKIIKLASFVKPV